MPFCAHICSIVFPSPGSITLTETPVSQTPFSSKVPSMCTRVDPEGNRAHAHTSGERFLHVGRPAMPCGTHELHRTGSVHIWFVWRASACFKSVLGPLAVGGGVPRPAIFDSKYSRSSWCPLASHSWTWWHWSSAVQRGDMPLHRCYAVWILGLEASAVPENHLKKRLAMC